MTALARRLITLQSLAHPPKPSRGSRYLAHFLQMASLARQRRGK